jgi:glycosyltransferase involved in cell wall biosynthesis
MVRSHTGSLPPNRVLVYLVTEDWYFMAHRVPMAVAAQHAGYDIHVITRVDKHRAAIESLGFRVHAVQWRRGSINPLALLNSIFAVRRHYRAIGPDLVHHVALQPTIVGSLAASGLTCVRLNALTGLGFVFTSETLKARLVRPVFRALLRYVFGHARAAVLVENPDDRATVSALGAAEECIFTIAGSGVDTDRLTPFPEPPEPVTMAFAGRLLEDKGVRTLVEAHEILGRRGHFVRLLIAGEPDPANPTSISSKEIKEWSRRPGVTVLGHVTDIRNVWKAAHIAVLVSRREGLPVSLLEAAACGRPMVASDVPGCREVARVGLNALVVAPDDAVALADAVESLAKDKNLRQKFGEAGRRLVENEYSAARVGADIVTLYDRLLYRKK